MDEVPVRAVDLGDLETGRRGPCGGGAELPDDLPDLIHRQLGGHQMSLGERYGAGRDRLPAVVLRADRTAAVPGLVGRRLAPRVGELDAARCALRGEEAVDPAERLDLGVVPDPEVERADPALRADSRRLGDDQTRTTDGASGEMREVPVLRHTGGRARGLGGVLTHGRHPHPVGQGQGPQGVGGEQCAHGRLLSEQVDTSHTVPTVVRRLSNYDDSRTGAAGGASRRSERIA